MSEFHYVRTLGRDGGVDAVNGPAVGIGLDQLLEDGLPPFKIALEVIAGMCEILDIADEDGEIHGDLSAGFVFIDDTGAVSVEGFGEPRDTTAAPEGQPDGHLTDLYGLGRVALSLITPKPLDVPGTTPDEHDDGVIDFIIGTNFEGLPEELVGDVQWYLAKLLSFDPEDRPPSIDVWRSFIAFADTVEGPMLEDWAPEAINGGGERRDAEEAAKPPTPPAPAEEDDEDLDGPVMMSGPLKRGGLNLGGGSAKSGQATAFWSRDQMKAALESQEEESDDGGGGGGFKPQAAAATAFWSKAQMQAASGEPEELRPKRKTGGSAPKAKAPEPEPAAEDWGAPAPAAPEPVAAAAPAAAAPAPAPVIQGPQSALPEPDDEAGGGGGKIAAVGAVVVFGLLCLGLLGAGGAYFALSGNGDSSGSATPSTTEEPTTPEVTPPPPPPPPAEAADTGSAEEKKPATEEKKPEPKPAASSSSRSSSSRSGSSSGSSTSRSRTSGSSSSGSSTSRSRSSGSSGGSVRPSSTSRSRSSGSTTSAPAAATSGFKVTFKGSGQGKIVCGDGKRVDFDGSKQLTFEGPTSCRVDMADGTSGAQYLESGGNCQVTSPMLTCQ